MIFRRKMFLVSCSCYTFTNFGSSMEGLALAKHTAVRILFLYLRKWHEFDKGKLFSFLYFKFIYWKCLLVFPIPKYLILKAHELLQSVLDECQRWNFNAHWSNFKETRPKLNVHRGNDGREPKQTSLQSKHIIGSDVTAIAECKGSTKCFIKLVDCVKRVSVCVWQLEYLSVYLV